MAEIPAARLDPPASDRAWFGLLESSAVLSAAVEHALQSEHGLSLSWFEVLLRLGHVRRDRGPEATLRIADLGGVVTLSASRVSRVVDALAARGLVDRRPGARDARATEVRLTDSGWELFESADATHRAVVEDRFLRLLDAEEVLLLSSIWARVAGAAPDPPPHLPGAWQGSGGRTAAPPSSPPADIGGVQPRVGRRPGRRRSTT